MNCTGVEKLAHEGVQLIVTVDCGITAIDPAKTAEANQVTLIITDHHEPKAKLPRCHSIVHPLLGDSYPNRALCGAGVAFKLAWALGKQRLGPYLPQYFKDLLKELLAFSSLGTIADCVALLGENRAMAHYGLKRLATTTFPGLQEFVKLARLSGKKLDGYDVGFMLAPRLNAAGRMGHAETALRMLTTASREGAAVLAQGLERQNRERQETEKKIVAHALAQAEQYPNAYALVIADKEYHPGVVGIVAARLVDKFYRPAIVLVEHEGECHGSCRSIEGFNLATALQSLEHLLIRWGGHALAAGVQLKTENVPLLRKSLNEYVRENCSAAVLERKVQVDSTVELSELTPELCADLERMGPFGNGNRRPLFASRGVTICEPRTIGKEGKHLAFEAHQRGCRRRCVWWSRGSLAHKIELGVPNSILFEPVISSWNGEVELHVRDLKAERT